MKYIDLVIILDDNLAIKSVTIDMNDTGLPSDSSLIKMVSVALLKSMQMNKESVGVQDILNELNIPTKPE